ncbi:MAG TPA: ergothioneine biosynthesis protein EgtB [Gammaproteobacteria bacterium]|nr:ergothioneine biosynthesis protein EgtB [Gammaproteobacteria bacterium]
MASVLELSSSESLAEVYRRVRGASTALVAGLEPEDFVVQTIPEVSPTKWHLAHVTWFFEKFCLLEHARGYRPFDERFHYLFNSYYYSVGEMHGRTERGFLSRPTLREVLRFREHVDAAMHELIAERSDDPELAFKVVLGTHHEQQHQELLLTDIKHVFFMNPLAPAYAAAPPRPVAQAAPLTFVPRAAGRFAVGAANDTGFCFDNETPRHDVLVDEHALANRLVTNGEYVEFIADGGYSTSTLWLADGWSRVQRGELRRPLYWSEDRAREFTLGGWQALELAAPVCHVSFYEADAFARWAGARLPSENEWELAAAPTPVAGNTLEHGALRPLPAGHGGENGLEQLWGDVWEWTSSPYVPYPRFTPLLGSLGEYNGKFMANQLVVRGGSCATWASHLRATYRSFFYPHDRWQFLGIRLAKDLP